MSRRAPRKAAVPGSGFAGGVAGREGAGDASGVSPLSPLPRCRLDRFRTVSPMAGLPAGALSAVPARLKGVPQFSDPPSVNFPPPHLPAINGGERAIRRWIVGQGTGSRLRKMRNLTNHSTRHAARPLPSEPGPIRRYHEPPSRGDMRPLPPSSTAVNHISR